MKVVVDAGPLVAAADRVDPRHAVSVAALTEAAGDLVVPAPVTAEVDYLLGERVGRQSRIAFLQDLASGRLLVADLASDDHAQIVNLEARYADLDAGLADLSIVVVAAKLGSTTLLTFDERHFRAIKPLRGDSFTLLPADRR